MEYKNLPESRRLFSRPILQEEAHLFFCCAGKRESADSAKEKCLLGVYPETNGQLIGHVE